MDRFQSADGGVLNSDSRRALAGLWRLWHNGATVDCAVLESVAGLQLRVRGEKTFLLSGVFHDGSRLLTRAAELRATFEEQGWTSCD